jgi:hypothetical protein
MRGQGRALATTVMKLLVISCVDEQLLASEGLSSMELDGSSAMKLAVA